MNMSSTIVISMSPGQRMRLLRFLDHVQLTGMEAQALVELRNLIASATPGSAALRPGEPGQDRQKPIENQNATL